MCCSFFGLYEHGLVGEDDEQFFEFFVFLEGLDWIELEF
jgi:hypothetical protein